MKNIFEIVQEVLLSADKYQSEDNNLLKAKVYCYLSLYLTLQLSPPITEEL
jgi:hypothetical protein